MISWLGRRVSMPGYLWSAAPEYSYFFVKSWVWLDDSNNHGQGEMYCIPSGVALTTYYTVP